MVTQDTTIDVLNDLVAVHNDRIESYSHALASLDDNHHFKGQLLSMIDQGRQFKMALGNEIEVYGGIIDAEGTVSGGIYTMWMELKVAFATDSNRSIIASSEHIEDTIQKAYSSALEDELPMYLRTMLTEQKAALREVHDTVKALRDSLG